MQHFIQSSRCVVFLASFVLSLLIYFMNSGTFFMCDRKRPQEQNESECTKRAARSRWPTWAKGQYTFCKTWVIATVVVLVVALISSRTDYSWMRSIGNSFFGFLSIQKSHCGLFRLCGECTRPFSVLPIGGVASNAMSPCDLALCLHQSDLSSSLHTFKHVYVWSSIVWHLIVQCLVSAASFYRHKISIRLFRLIIRAIGPGRSG